MSTETSNDAFRANMIAQIKEIQEMLNELKIIKTRGGKKSTKRKTAKRKTVKRKPAKRKTVKRKPAKRRTKAKRKTSRRR